MPLNKEQKMRLLGNLVRATAVDQLMMRIIRAGKMVGFYHEGGVALAPGVAAGSFLRKDDILNPHYRAHASAHMLSKGIDIRPYVAEHAGRSTGCCKGRSSFHWSFPADGVYGTSGNIGANFPVCVGYGFSAKYQKSDRVVMNCSGDGSYNEGRAHEAMLMAAKWRLPIIFWCENNGISQHSSIKDLFPGDRISALAAGYGIPASVVDGQDLFACGEAALKAIKHVRAGKGPVFVEAMTLRSQEHSVGGLNNEGVTPRDPALMAEWKETRNPLPLAIARALAEGLCTQADIDALQAAAEREMRDIEDFVDQSPKATPPVEELMQSVYAV